MERLPTRLSTTRGSRFTLDLAISNSFGDPFMVFALDSNPYLVFDVVSARYKQDGDFRQTYWTSLSAYYDSTQTLQALKKFIGTKALYTPSFSDTVIAGPSGYYTNITTDDEEAATDICNFLFYTNSGGKRVYKYCERSTTTPVTFIWYEYDFHILQIFDTSEWIEQTYLIDIKYVCGETLRAAVSAELTAEGISPTTDLQNDINSVTNEMLRLNFQKYYDDNNPMYAITGEVQICPPIPVDVAGNIQGGI